MDLPLEMTPFQPGAPAGIICVGIPLWAAALGLIAAPLAAQELDVNRDGVVDFAVEPGREYWDYANYVNWWDLVPRGTSAISTNTTFAVMDVVGPDPASAWLGTVPPRLFSQGNIKVGPGMSWPTFGGLLWTPRDLYLGLRLAAAEGVHYGWVQFHLTEQIPFSYQVTLVATAFQPHPGQPILVGRQPPLQPAGLAAPLILEPPSSRSVRAGEAFALAVVATANPFPTYEWWRGGQPIPGATWNALQIHDAQPGDTGDYQVTVSNAQGSTQSQVAHVFVGYALEVRVDRGGTVRVDPARELYEPGQPVQLEAVPDVGWRFLGWEGDASGMTNPFTLTINRHHRVKAVFASGPGDLKWAFKAGGAVSPCPAIGADGALYFGVADRIVALDAETAQARWEFRTGGAVLASPAVGDGGRVYAGSGDSRVYALNGVTGRKEWEYLTDGRVYTPLSIGPEGTVYACSDNGTLHALSGATGRKLWQDTVLGHDFPAIGLDGTVYVVRRGAEQCRVYAVNPTTGQRLWYHTIDSPRAPAPALGADGTVYVSSGVGVYALEGATGQVRWSNALVSYAPPAIVPDGTVLVVSGGGFGLSRDTGQIRWRGSYDVGDWMPRAEATPAIGSDGTAYVAVGALGNCRPPEPPSQEPICESFTAAQALDGVTGQKIWSWKNLGGDATAPAIGPDGTVYVASGSTLYAFLSASVQGLAASPWPKFRGDARNTGRVSAAPPLRLDISWQQGVVRIEWVGSGVLQSSDVLFPATWQDVSDATNPYAVEPANAQRFYRLRPRSQRKRRGTRRRISDAAGPAWGGGSRTASQAGHGGVDSSPWHHGTSLELCALDFELRLPSSLASPGSSPPNRSRRSRSLRTIAAIVLVLLGGLSVAPARAAVAFRASVCAGAAEKGFVDGSGADARFASIVALDGDGAGNLYVADAGNQRIRKVDRRGQVTTLAGTGEAIERDGPALGAAFRDLRDLGVDGAGSCYVLDGSNLRRLGTDGVVSTLGAITIPTGELSYTNYEGWGPDAYEVRCTADEFFGVQDLTVSGAGEVRVLSTARKVTARIWLRFGVWSWTWSTITQISRRTDDRWVGLTRSELVGFTCDGCVPPGTPPPEILSGTVIAAVAKGSGGPLLVHRQEFDSSAEGFGRLDWIEEGAERPYATHLVGLPEVRALAAMASDSVLLLGRRAGEAVFLAVGRDGLAVEVAADRAPEIGLVVSPHGIVYSATATGVLRFVPEGIVVLDLETIASGGATLVLSTVASPGRRIRVEQSLDLRSWEIWRTVTSSGRDEWEVGTPSGVRWFRARTE
ncbi:MAG: PQQ-binding-like beta-propeller repeat protein [Verrucomicrobiales bacterium]|nr:PQQ-binding-like beta-propeller repeat protein [Verrucomicrobiales bacterium]